MELRQPFEQIIAFVGDVDVDLAAIFGATLPADEAEPDGAIYQPDDAMLAHLEAVGKLRDGGKVAPGEPFDGEQQLMLLGGDALATRGLLAEAEEPANGVAKCGDCLDIRLGYHRVVSHQGFRRWFGGLLDPWIHIDPPFVCAT